MQANNSVKKELKFEESLKTTLQDSFDQTSGDSAGDKSLVKFSAKKLYKSWFRNRGTPYYFLFKKNLSCTNIQFAELFALVRMRFTGDIDEGRNLHFVTIDDFLKDFGDVAAPLFDEIKDKNTFIEKFIELYAEILRPIVVIEPFFGSCTIFFPPHLTLDLFKVCAESGYIHSCGYNIYTRRLDKAFEEDFLDSIGEYLKSRTKKVFFKVYAHEDFRSDGDRNAAADLRSGLDDVKIYLEKYYISNKPLVEVVQDIKKAQKDQLIVTDKDKQQVEKFYKNTLDREHSLWLIVDRSVSGGEDCRLPGDKRFLICYEQHYKNENAFQIFNENKPAWICHTTMPHTLAAAMINITRPWWSKKKRTRLADPFAGTGTVWLESLKFLPDVDPYCADLSPLAPLLADDNLRFFSYNENELADLVLKLELVVKTLENNAKTSEEKTALSDYERTQKLAKDYLDNENLYPKHKKITEKKIQNEEYFPRFLFYIGLRAAIRHGVAIKRKKEIFKNAFLHETKILIDQIKLFHKLKREENNSKKEKGMFSEFIGEYSLSTCISSEQLNMIFREKYESVSIAKVETRDAQFYTTSKPSIDLIVADPPYGFNTDDNFAKLAEIYVKSIRNMLKNLSDNGQLVLCLPDSSYTGRSIASFSTKRWVISQVLAEAQSQGFEAICEAQVLPSIGNLSAPPYYWESARALRRAIVHFRFQRREGALVRNAHARDMSI
jgi:tRNA G10  N-methylase Trm11